MTSKTKAPGKFRIRKSGSAWWIDTYTLKGERDKRNSHGPYDDIAAAKHNAEAMERDGWQDWDKEIAK